MKKLAVFARNPILGRVKTRLSPAVPAALVVEAYAAIVEDTLEAAAGSAAEERVLYWAEEDAAPLPPTPDGFRVRRQPPGDLGRRLAAAFSELLPGSGDQAVVVGSDCPDLTPALLDDAFRALAAHDLVLGPARDGGYYLIGLTAPRAALFEGIAWGSERVLAVTMARASAAGLRTLCLPEREDLDTPDDLVRLIARRSVAEPASSQRLDRVLRGAGLLPPRA